MNTVEPIRRVKKIEEIKEYLKENECRRNYLLFVLGINSALRISDLLSLKVNNVRNPDGTLKDELYIRESKTNKEKFYAMSNSAKDAIRYYFNGKEEISQDDWLFESQTHDKPINRSWAWSLVNRWTDEVNLEGNYGTHSLRKTFGYIARTEHDAPINLLMSKFNHSNQGVTRRYIGIEQEEVAELERKVNL